MIEPSQLGRLIRKTRQRQGFSLRAFARAIGKSPAYIVKLETASSLPSISEDTLAAIAKQLALDRDQLLVLAAKFPAATIPKSQTEIALYRLIKELPTDYQEQLRAQLEANPEETSSPKRSDGGIGAEASPGGISPYATGGGGVTFERKVAAQYLAHLLVGDGASELGEALLHSATRQGWSKGSDDAVTS